MPLPPSPSQMIARKRDGKELTEDEIRELIRGITNGAIPDYQATAFLMATYFRGMTLNETVAFTRAMLESGIRHDLSQIPGIKVDKHSTGGVGDKVSLILAPLAAACGLKVPMMAGRGLGHSGGTIDKLESIEGYTAELVPEKFEEIVAKVGCAIIGQSTKIAPADRKLYALRDVTATIDCLPLIVGSILSKKIAEGADALVMDVKIGNGAFMKTREQARRLAKELVRVAHKMGLPCRVLLTDMNQPLGYACGNALEVVECIHVLRNDKVPDGLSCDLRELTIQICAQMLEIGKVVKNVAAGRKLASSKLADGSAWECFERMVEAQGGSLDQIRNPERLPRASIQRTWKAGKRGYITRMDTEAIGWLLVDMGAGRRKVTDKIDPGVGLVFHRKLGARVENGDAIATVHVSNEALLPELEERFFNAIEVSGTRKPVPKLILEQI